ncbi:MAG: dihydroorotase [Acidimicrobiaceae bacterium]|nr:dihydroorotase [Acidimicrobiaceae bacterium]
MSGEKVVVKGGLVLKPAGLFALDIAIEGEVITEVSPAIDAFGSRVIDATGCVVSTSFYDTHTHSRYPGDSEAETIDTLSEQGLLGGYQYLLAMANTEPTIDSVSIWKAVREELRKAPIEVDQAASITLGRKGERLVDFVSLVQAGASFFTDDGTGVGSTKIMYEALKMSELLGVTVAQHAQDPYLFEGASMNLGATSVRLGLIGEPEASESSMVARDIELLKATGGRLHVLHVSARESINLIRMARNEGLRISAEVTPHHLLLDDSLLCNFDTSFKVNPPLRSKSTQMAIVASAIRGDFDAIATDHAPHPYHSKQRPFSQASFGMIGLQSAFSASWTAFSEPPASPTETAIATDHWSHRVADRIGLEPYELQRLHRLLEMMGPGAARVVGRRIGIEPDMQASIVICDPTAQSVGKIEDIASNSTNFPYEGRTLRGKVVAGFVRGKEILKEGKLWF